MSRRVPTSSFAQLQARRRYYQRNREAVCLQIKLRKSGVSVPMHECRRMVESQ